MMLLVTSLGELVGRRDRRPDCSGCGAPVPETGSYASGFWSLAGRDGPETLCPGCLAGARRRAAS